MPPAKPCVALSWPPRKSTVFARLARGQLYLGILSMPYLLDKMASSITVKTGQAYPEDRVNEASI